MLSSHVKKRAVLIAFCGGFILFGIIGAVSSFSDWRNGQRSLSWPSTQGEITFSQRRKSSQRLKRLEYRYSIDGTTYDAHRAAFMRVPYTKPLYKTYRSGQQAQVYYDPAAPDRSVLEPGTPFLAIIAEALIPVLLIGFGAAGLIYGFRR